MQLDDIFMIFFPLHYYFIYFNFLSNQRRMFGNDKTLTQVFIYEILYVFGYCIVEMKQCRNR